MRAIPATRSFLVFVVPILFYSAGVKAWRMTGKANPLGGVEYTRQPTPDNTGLHSPIVGQGDSLKLCECEEANLSSHGGLQCEKEGWFIQSFEREGKWIHGGGRVPLSRAKCCRICVPDDIDESTRAKIPAGAKPEAIVSIGCHGSTVIEEVHCESFPGTSFVSGFQHAILVSTLAASTFFPEGPVTCCTPVLVLSTGDAWEIERCECGSSVTSGCGHVSANSLLWGYDGFRLDGEGRHVPVAPAQCCEACLGSQVHRMDACEDLNHCSHRGVCVLGSCDCHEGWGGPDCKDALAEEQWPPLWVTYAGMGLCVALCAAALLAVRYLLIDLIERRRQVVEENAAMLDPLIVAEGDVGDTDTEDEDDLYDSDGIERLIPARARDTSPPAASSASAGDGAVPLQPETQEAAQEDGGGDDGEGKLALLDNEAGVSGDESEIDEEEAALQAELAVKFDEKRSPLSSVKCSICYDRPVQVALVPCGHSNLCRKCARRLDDCPYCRKPIVRRQRLYLTADI